LMLPRLIDSALLSQWTVQRAQLTRWKKPKKNCYSLNNFAPYEILA